MPTTTTGKASEFITFSRTSNATVTDSDGKIKWAPHNLLTNSESFDASSWTKNAVTVAANSVAAPNGTTTADTATETAAPDLHAAFQSVDLIAGGVTYTFTVFAKANTRTHAMLRIGGGSFGTGPAIRASLSGSGSVTTLAGTVASSSISLVGDGWYLISMTFASGSVAAHLPQCGPHDGGSATTYTGDITKSVYLWGASLTRSDLGGMKANTSAYPMYNPTTPKNLLGQSEGFDTATWTKSGLAATPVIANAITAPNGLLSADKIVENSSASTHYIAQSAGTLQTSPYTLTVYAKAAERSFVSVGFDGLNAWFNLASGVKGTVEAGLTADMVSVGDGWYRCWVRRTVAVSAVKSCAIYIATADNAVSYTGDGVSGIYLWGAQLSDSASLDAYVPNNGAAPTAAAYYGPRLDADPVTLSQRGLLVEEARSNLALNSAAVGGAGYNLRNTTIATNAGIAPDGTNTATKLRETAVTDFFDGYQSITVTSGATYTMSVYAKAAERNWIWIQAANGNQKTWFNLSTGVVGTNGAGNTSTITAVGNGWYRCTVSCAAGTTTGYIDVGLSNADNTVVYAGVALSGVLVWGAQLEAGSFATSYIPVGATTAGATRTADVASVSTSQFPYSASEGTVVVNWTQYAVPTITTRVLTLDDGTSNNILQIQSSPSNRIGAFDVGGANVFAISTTATTANATNKEGVAYQSGSSAVAVGGSLINSSSGTFTGPNMSIMRLGNNVGGGQNINGHIRQITYLPQRISNAELQTRTA